MQGKVAIIITAFLFATIGVFTKLIGRSMPVMSLSFFRVFFAVLFLAALLPMIDKSVFRIKKEDIRHYAIIGFLMAIDMSLYMAAMMITEMSNVILIGTVGPFLVLILSFFFLKEKATTYKIIIVFISIFAVYLLNPFSSIGSHAGNLMALGAALMHSIILTYMRFEDKKHTLGIIFWLLLFECIFLLPFPFIYGVGNLAEKWHLVVLLGFLSTAMAYLFLTFCLERLQAGTTSILEAIFAPFFGVILAIVLFSETILPRMLIAGIMLIGSGIYLELKRMKG